MNLNRLRAQLAALPPEADNSTVATVDPDGQIGDIKSVKYTPTQHFEGLPDEVGSSGTTWIEVDEI